MNLQSIKYLTALAQHRHFGKAAKMCFVSQPTLSMQIKKLEDRLDVQLLERTNKSVRLTAIGEAISIHAHNILRETEAIREIAKAAKDPFQGPIKIGVIPTVAPYLLPKIIFKLKKIFPKLIFLFIEKQTQFLLEELKQGKLDTAILALPITDSRLEAKEFFKEDFLLALSKNHSWANKKSIKATDLSGENLLLLDEGHCLRDQALSWCYQTNATELEDFRATSLETLRQIIAVGEYITFMPKLACKSNDGLSYIAFSGEKPSRTLGLVWRKSTGRILLFNKITDHIQQICANL